MKTRSLERLGLGSPFAASSVAPALLRAPALLFLQRDSMQCDSILYWRARSQQYLFSIACIGPSSGLSKQNVDPKLRTRTRTLRGLIRLLGGL